MRRRRPSFHQRQKWKVRFLFNVHFNQIDRCVTSNYDAVKKDKTRLKHSFEILVNIDLTGSHTCCRFVHPLPKVALLTWDLVRPLNTLNSLSCSRNQFEMFWDLWHTYLVGNNIFWRWVHCGLKRWTWSTAILLETVAIKWCSLCTGPEFNKKISPTHHHSTCSLKCQFLFLTLTSECSSRNQGLSNQAMCFHSSVV